MRVEEFVGQRIRQRRDELNMSQAELGRRVGDLLGKPWPRQAVSAAELGKRALGVAELVALASVLETRASRLLTPPIGESEITLPGGAVLDAQRMVEFGASSRLLTEVYETLSGLDQDLSASVNYGHEALAQVRTLADRITTSAGSESGPRGSRISPSGGIEDYDVVNNVWVPRGQSLRESRVPRQPAPVVAAVVTSGEGVLLGRRRDGTPPWTFIAGEIEPGERAEDAAIREVKEETGCEIRPGQIIGQREHPATGRLMIYMTATPARSTTVFVGDEAELAEVRWASLDEALSLLPDMFGPVRDYLAGLKL